MRKFLIFPLLVIVFSITVLAQNAATCSAVVEQIITAVGDICADTGRNQACYGNVSLNIIPRGTATDYTFQQVGDVMDVAQIQTLRTLPLNQETGQWGVAMLRLQANLPQTLPGQNVTFLVFGDTQLTSAVPDGNTTATPMQAFYLQSGLGQAACNEVPENGLLVQTPTGAGQITFSMNGMNVSIGSTAYFQSAPNNRMKIITLEGATGVRYGNESYPIVAGTQFEVELDDDLLPIDDTGYIESYELDELDDLPLELLDREIEIAVPFTDDELDDLYDRLDEDLPPCGEGPYPDCSHLARFFGGDGCMFDDAGECLDEDFDFEWGDDGIGDFEFDWMDAEEFDDYENIDDLENFDDVDDFSDETDDTSDIIDDTFDEVDDSFDEIDDSLDEVDDEVDDLGDIDGD